MLINAFWTTTQNSIPIFVYNFETSKFAESLNGMAEKSPFLGHKF